MADRALRAMNNCASLGWRTRQWPAVAAALTRSGWKVCTFACPSRLRRMALQVGLAVKPSSSWPACPTPLRSPLTSRQRTFPVAVGRCRFGVLILEPRHHKGLRARAGAIFVTITAGAMTLPATNTRLG
jgi:hypothetical protein